MAVMERHGALEAARADAFGWAARANDSLQHLPRHPVRDLLVELADYVVSRIA